MSDADRGGENFERRLGNEGERLLSNLNFRVTS